MTSLGSGRRASDVSDADAVLMAVAGRAITDALKNVQGLGGKTVIDATNLIGAEPPSGFPSNAEFIKSKTNGPTVKSFNLNFASQYGKLGEAKPRPSNIWSARERLDVRRHPGISMRETSRFLQACRLRFRGVALTVPLNPEEVT